MEVGEKCGYVLAVASRRICKVEKTGIITSRAKPGLSETRVVFKSTERWPDEDFDGEDIAILQGKIALPRAANQRFFYQNKNARSPNKIYFSCSFSYFFSILQC
jgi:hypothetical protein